MHEEQCALDKRELKEGIRAINGKLWALIIAGLIQSFAVIGYLVDKNWDANAAVLADRGERK